MLNALVQSVLETRHLYQQNAAMKHGIPVPPSKVSTNIYVHRDPQPQQQPVPVQREVQPPADVPPKHDVAAPVPAVAASEPKPSSTWIPPAPPPPAGPGFAPANNLPGAATIAGLLGAPLLTIAAMALGAFLAGSSRESSAPVVVEPAAPIVIQQPQPPNSQQLGTPEPEVGQDSSEPLLEYLERRGYNSPSLRGGGGL